MLICVGTTVYYYWSNVLVVLVVCVWVVGHQIVISPRAPKRQEPALAITTTLHLLITSGPQGAMRPPGPQHVLLIIQQHMQACCMHSLKNMFIHTLKHSHTYSQFHTDSHTRSHTLKRPRTLIHTHTHTLTHTHTHIH